MPDREESQAVRKRSVILEAAQRLFLDRGFDGTTMDHVTAAAGVSKPTLYNHFASKDALFAAVVDATTVEVGGVMKAMAATSAEGADIPVALEDLAMAFLDVLMQPDLIRLRRLVISTADRHPEISRHWYDAGFGRVLQALAEAFSQLDARGVLACDDTAAAAEHFAGLVLWIPMNQAMFRGGATKLTRSQATMMAKRAVTAFLVGYRRENR